MSNNVMTPVGVLCFPHLFEPAGNKQNPAQEKRYSCILLFDKLATESTKYKELRAAVQAAAAEKWGEAKAADPAFMRSLRLPFRPAAEKDYGGFEKGEIYINPWSSAKNAPPQVVDVRGTEINVPSDVWAGQKARATVRAFAYDSNGNRGVSFGLEHVQIVKQDEPRIDGRRSATDAFANADNSEFAAHGIDPNASSSPSGDAPW